MASKDAILKVWNFISKGRGFDRVMKDIRILSAGEGRCSIEFEVTEDVTNKGGSLHGGYTATLVDNVTTLALMTTGDAVPGVSVNMSITYMKAAQMNETLLADAEVKKVGKTLAFTDATLRRKSDSSIIAHGTHTKFVGGA